MATRFYLNNSPPIFVPTTVRGAWNAIPSSHVAMLGTSKFGGVIGPFTESEAVVTAPWSTIILRGISSSLQAQTISGYVNVLLGITENNADANFYWHAHIYVTQGNTDTVRGILVDNYKEDNTNEWSSSGKALSFQFDVPLNPVTVVSGDKIVVELGYVARNVISGSRTGSIWYGTQKSYLLEDAPDLTIIDTDVLNKAGSINFSQNLLFEITPEEIGHIQAQAGQRIVNAGTRISHLVSHVAGRENAVSRISHITTQVIQHDNAPARIAHIVIQVVQGTPAPLGDISGLYFINPKKSVKHDSYYNSTQLKVPNPTIRLALFGE